ncbi:protein-L-isoaspartate O-methyltransferase family protein [Rhodoferax aquaticus]|uniref:Protein-L-isoaspartate O-methyltransferase n=1 Tax=Rhodoferax aquaticus TaxID=2527691 RepID=A0A515EMK0_9BURK|nr:protein-L-isoaspartate O-methyltransferase [Rhodoferax aquaticus]QDL53885.1 protein-L-isoaspartate O-methyltransferase [Rhodoferax aquaticus]
MNLTDIAHSRFNMIEQQIRPWNVLDADILELLSVVKREDFAPAAHRDLAFADIELPLPAGQCMLNPKVEARMLQDLKVQAHETVLEVGSGSGYMAALLAHRAQHVLSLEIIPELADMARANVQKAGLTQVEVRCADGSHGAATDGPFDVIVLSGSVGEVPQALLSQLKVGGRFMAIVGDEPIMRAHLVTRKDATNFTTTEPWDICAPRLVNFAEPSRFTF